jgi:hypothetical protein
MERIEMTQDKSRREEPEEPATEGATAEPGWWSGCGCSPDQFRELNGAGPMGSCESMMSGFAASPQGMAGCCGPSDASGHPTPKEPPEAASEPEASQPG